MLGRRQIREKVLQAIYAYNNSGTQITAIEKNMFDAMNGIYDLHVFQLNLIIAVKEYALELQEARKVKRIATEQERNPNTKFTQNKAILLLEENIERKNHTEKNKQLQWNLHSQYPTYIFKKFEISERFQKYFEDPNISFEADLEITIRLFRRFIAENEMLHDFFEEQRLFWADDFHIANNMTLRTLKSMEDNGNSITLIKIFKNDEDESFAKSLLHQTIKHYHEFLDIIKERSKNWKLDRIAEIDKIIISMALCELNYFPSIPPKVIINEYIELAKAFSTNSSNVFVNGILDKYVKEKITRE